MTDQADARGHSSPLHRRPIRLALLAGTVGVLGLVGCGPDADERALSDASIKLSSIDVGVGTRVPPGVSGATYNEVINAMQPLAAGEGALAADAAVLVAQAQRGRGIHALDQAAALENDAINMMPGIRARLRGWQMHNAAAEAAAAYDPSPELSRIDADVRARQEEAEQQRSRKAEIESRVSELLNQVADRLAKASALRDDAGSLQLRIPSVTATEGLELAERIRELSREADRLEFEARDLKNQADRLALDVQGSKVQIDKLTTQVELLGQSRAAVQARAKASEEEAARARADAQKAAAEIAARVDTGDGALTPFRENQIVPATEEALREFQAAASSARGGVGARRSNAQIAIGQAQQSLGDTLWNRALGYEAYGQLMEELATAEPALPAAAEYASRAGAAQASANEARQSAFEAYQAAKGAYESTGASGEARDLLDQVSIRLNEISRQVGEGVVDSAALDSLSEPEIEQDAAPEDEADGYERGEAAPAADAEEEIRSLLRNIEASVEAGRYTELVRHLHPASDAEARIIDQLAGPLEAFERLDRVTADSFGQSFTAWLEEQAPEGMGGQTMNPAEMFKVSPDEMDVRVRGDEAIVLTGDPESPEIPLRRIDGEWKIVLEADQLGMNDVPPEMQQAMEDFFPRLMQASGDAYAAAADGVESGALRSNQAVMVSITNTLQPLMMELMQEMMGPGGG